MKKFVAIAAAGTIALCLSTTSFARVMPDGFKHGMMMKAGNMERRDAKKEIKAVIKKLNKRLITDRERARQLRERAKEIMKRSSSSSSVVSSAAASSAASSAAATSSSAAVSSSMSSAQ